VDSLRTLISSEKRKRICRAIGRAYKVEGVPDSPELQRIMAIPRRVWDSDLYEGMAAEELAQMMTQHLKTPEGEQALWPVQAKALQEAHDLRGAFGPIAVGKGKTLISFLAPVVMEAERPLLIVPARLRRKTVQEFQELAKHWKAHPDLQIVSYEKISRQGGQKLLEERDVDLLIFDEVHRLKSRRAAVTRKVRDWVKEHPEVPILAMSGTITSRSLFDFSHVLRWAALEKLYPLPKSDQELASWAAAVDEIKPKEARMQGAVGALEKFCNPTEKLALEKKTDDENYYRNIIRGAVRRRINETPGVVAQHADGVDASLNIVLTSITGYNDKVLELAEGLRRGEKPNGDIMTDNDLATRWFIYRSLSSGFWYDWVPPPPLEWKARRSAWKKHVREYIKSDIKGLESELLITNYISRSGEEEDPEAYKAFQEWREVKDTYKYDIVPRWVDDNMIQYVAKWSRNHKGIIWVSEVALGQRIEKDLGFPYFHQMGVNKDGFPIEGVKPDGCIVASVASNSEGRNLQAWSDNLIISPFPTGKVWEQVLGRTHRPGQKADEVWVEVVIGCMVEWECWKQARKDAEYASQIEAVKKLDYATVVGKMSPRELEF